MMREEITREYGHMGKKSWGNINIFNLRRKLSQSQCSRGLCCFSLPPFQSPVLTPPVNIHAPVVMAALIRPFPKTCLSFGWSSKFCRPPWTEMRSLGSSNCHSLVIRCKRRSGFVSKDTRTYWKKNSHGLVRAGLTGAAYFK